MKIGNKRLVIVGDRVLVKPEDLQERTEVGLYLPQTVIEKEEVKGGRVVLTGPGIPLPESPEEDEPWRNASKAPRYLPMQAEQGDYALFLQKAAMEIKFEGEKFLIVSHSSILVLMREDENILGGEDILDDIEGLEDIDI